jgi:protein ImuB
MDTLGLLVGEKTFTGDRFKPPQSFYNEVQNPQGIYSKESLLFPMKTLLQQFCQYLAVLQCHSLQLEWTFEPLLGKHQKIILSLSGSNNSWSNFLNLSRLKLERIDLPQSIERISLSSDKFIDMPDLNVDLFNNQFDLNKEEKGLIDNLSARLGLEALSKLVMNNEYLPEKVSTLEPIHQNLDSKYIISKSYKPIWLLAEPSPAKWYKKQLYWGNPLKILSGPERLCGNWWQSEQKRDYYLVSDSEGSRYWIFRELLSNQWFVHGVFA